MIVTGDDVARFVSGRLDFALCPPFTAMGLARDGTITAGVLFNHFEGADCHLTVAGKGWTRAFLQAVGSYVFDQLECERMTFVTEQPEVERLAIRLGGEVEGRLRNHYGYGRDGIVIGVLREEWKYRKVSASERG
jgi:RimJ/RimL family protein N-acetyltransferase